MGFSVDIVKQLFVFMKVYSNLFQVKMKRIY